MHLWTMYLNKSTSYPYIWICDTLNIYLSFSPCFLRMPVSLVTLQNTTPLEFYACNWITRSVTTNLLDLLLNLLLTTLTRILNMSLSSVKMSEALKVAEFWPVLKKPDANYKSFSNFRPISNLKIIWKEVEKVVAMQLTDQITPHQLDEWFQSAELSVSPTLNKDYVMLCYVIVKRILVFKWYWYRHIFIP